MRNLDFKYEIVGSEKLARRALEGENLPNGSWQMPASLWDGLKEEVDEAKYREVVEDPTNYTVIARPQNEG